MRIIKKLWSNIRGMVAQARSELTENRPYEFSWRKDFRWHYLKALIAIFILMGAVYVMQISGMLKGFEMASLDTFLRLNGRQMSDEIRIVEITEKDYMDKNLFNGQSPLNSGLLISLIEKVKDYDPAVIGVDFDTSDSQWRQQHDFGGLQADADAEKTRIVWAEVPRNTEAPLTLTLVLGGRLVDLKSVGIPRFPIESDGWVRRYESELQVTGTCDWDPCFIPSFSMAILKNWKKCPIRNPKTGSLPPSPEEAVFFNFYGDRYRFPVMSAHDFIAHDAVEEDPALLENRKGLLENKVVLIGGSYKAARDKYMSPLGEMAGVELIALALQSEIDGGGIGKAQEWWELSADFVVGSLVVVVFFAWPHHPRRVFWCSIFGFFAAALVISLLIFKTAAYWFSFMPIVIGMIMHQAIELAQHAQHSQDELAASERKTAGLKSKLKYVAESARQSQEELAAELEDVTEIAGELELQNFELNALLEAAYNHQKKKAKAAHGGAG